MYCIGHIDNSRAHPGSRQRALDISTYLAALGVVDKDECASFTHAPNEVGKIIYGLWPRVNNVKPDISAAISIQHPATPSATVSSIDYLP
jgi:hypothetical protein